MIPSSYNVFASESPLKVIIGSAVGNPGDVVNITISTENTPSIGYQAAGFKLHYDTSVLSVTDLDITPGNLIVYPSKDFNVVLDPAKGIITIAYMDDTAGSRMITTNGILANIKFKILDNAKAGTYNIIETEQLGFTDADFNEIGDLVIFVNGSITVNGTTPVDTTPPVLTTPTASEITATTAKVEINANEAGTAYWVALPVPGTTPTGDYIVNCSDTSIPHGNENYAAANAAQKLNITGLTPNTQYYVFVVVKDVAGNISVPVMAPVTTLKTDKQIAIDNANAALALIPAPELITIENMNDIEAKVIAAENAVTAARALGAVDLDFVGFDKIQAAKDKIALLKQAAGTFVIENVTGVNEFVLGGEAKVTVKATNNTAAAKNATLIIGLFEKNTNKLISYVCAEKSVAPTEIVQLTGRISLPATGNYVVKAFVWDSLEGMNPLSDVLTFQVN